MRVSFPKMISLFLMSQRLLSHPLIYFSNIFDGVYSTRLLPVTTLIMISCSFIFCSTQVDFMSIFCKIVFTVHFLFTHHSITFLSLFSHLLTCNNHTILMDSKQQVITLCLSVFSTPWVV